MAVIDKEFNSYRIRYNSNKASNPNKTEAAVIIYFNNKNVGALRFREVLPLPVNVLNLDGTAELYYHLDRFNDIITILRYEKPLRVQVTSDGDGRVYTGFEPTGEEET